MSAPDTEELVAAVEALRRELARRPGPIATLGWQLARGLAFGLGTALGASLLVSVLGWWLARLEILPIVGEWAAEILRDIESRR
ncbi:MAG: DUF5665 domain-containing protein [Gemmobacter sp.]